MKIRIEIDEKLKEEEMIIRAPALDERIQKIQSAVMQAASEEQRFLFFKGETTYYMPLSEILFYETEGSMVKVHTKDDIYDTRHRLYELEEMLPGYFFRVSKSTILNIRHIYAMTKSLSSSCVVEFKGTHKQVYVSRHYYKPLKNRLEEKR